MYVHFNLILTAEMDYIFQLYKAFDYISFRTSDTFENRKFHSENQTNPYSLLT